MSEIKVKWSVDDGYIGNRPHSMNVNMGDFYHCDTAQEVEDELEELVRQEFENRISLLIADRAAIVEQVIAWKRAESDDER